MDRETKMSLSSLITSCLVVIFLSVFFVVGETMIHDRNAATTHHTKARPEFMETIPNVTVFMGREAAITCSVKDLGNYRVAWLRAEPDIGTLLSVHTSVITNDGRLRISHHNHQKWTLHIKDVMDSDAGSYMCQINTEPMMSQMGYLDVLVPPTIIDEGTSTDVSVEERGSVSLRCRANGYPTPTVTWRREDGKELNLLGSNGGKKHSLFKLEGEYLNISQVSREDMAAYLCIISNSVPPSVSKRIFVQVNFQPKIRVSNQLIGASRGSHAVMECFVEAWPRPLTSWIRHDQTLLLPNHKYQITEHFEGYRVKMRLKLVDITDKDFGAFKCVARNTIGEKEGFIRLYETKVATTESSSHETDSLSSGYIISTTEQSLSIGAKKQSSKGDKESPNSDFSAQSHQHSSATKIVRIDATGDTNLFRRNLLPNSPFTTSSRRPMSSGCTPTVAISSALTICEVFGRLLVSFLFPCRFRLLTT